MFKDTQKAFKHKSTRDLKLGVLLFKSFNYPFLIKYGPKLAERSFRIGLPIKGIIKKTLFSWFCGGESIEDCLPTIANLHANKVGTILDYSVEGDDDENAYEATAKEIINTIKQAEGNEAIPFSVFKATGLIKNNLLEKVSNDSELSALEKEEYAQFENYFESICKEAATRKVRVFVDAEETWLQKAIDDLTYKMMEKYNTDEVYIFNTIQLYRHDRLAHLKNQITNHTYKQGYKLVRGAYLEKENQRAIDKGYTSPMQSSKDASDRDYNLALELCTVNISKVAFCAGTHNEQSCKILTELMKEMQIDASDKRIWFAQLMGMSDNISFNLSALGYNVGKYVPYGPVRSVLPYLARRAQENSSIAGQMGRELGMLEEELRRRRQVK